MPDKLYNRKLLNKDSGLAAIQTTAQIYNKHFAYGCVEISDCRHAISLDFDYDTPAARKLKAQKLDTLLEVLTAFKAQYFA